MWKRLKAMLGGSAAAMPSRTSEFKGEDRAAPGEIVRAFDSDRAAALRDRFLRGRFGAIVERMFEHDPSLRSAMVLVAQYWDDEAHDAVHHDIVWSELETPDLEAAKHAGWISGDDVNLGGRKQFEWDPFDDPYIPYDQWSDNGHCIPLFAGFCIEGASQEDDRLENYAPVAVYRRTEGAPTVEMVGELVRPWLEGVAADWAALGGAHRDVEQWVDGD